MVNRILGAVNVIIDNKATALRLGETVAWLFFVPHAEDRQIEAPFPCRVESPAVNVSDASVRQLSVFLRLSQTPCAIAPLRILSKQTSGRRATGTMLVPVRPRNQLL